MMRTTSGFIIGSILASACTLVIPVDDLTSGDGPAPDGGGMDASAADADASDAGARSPCSSGSHVFCMDFEGVDPLSQWTSLEQTAPGVLQVTADRAHSPSHAMHAHNPRLAAGEKRYVDALKTFPGAWRRVVLDFEVYVVRPAFSAGDSNFGIFGIAFWSNGAVQESALSVTETATVLAVSSDGRYLGGTDGSMLPWDTWVHVHVEATPGGPVHATVGGIELTTSLPALAAWDSPRIDVTIGVLGYNSPVPDVDVYVDDVTVDLP